MGLTCMLSHFPPSIHSNTFPNSLFLVPGSDSPLSKVYADQGSLLLSYEDRLVRQWEIKTQEFRRSTTDDKAKELTKIGEWLEW
jgi:hypothetical protein